MSKSLGMTPATCVKLSSLLVLSMLFATTVAAAPTKGVAVLDGTAQAQTIPARGKSHSGVIGTLSAAALSAPTLDLTLADGQVVTARLQRVVRDDQKGVQSWVGTFDDAPGSLLVLSKAKGVVTGYANYKEQTLELLPAAGGKHVLFAVDTARQPKTDLVNNNLGEAADVMATSADYGTGGATTLAGASAGAVVHDVLILYTAASANKWGRSTLESMVQSAVQAANQAYVNSHANVTMNVVGLQQSSVSESGGMGGTVDALKNNTTVRSLRDSLAADMVVLVSENTDYCGYATLWYSYSGSSTNWDAYAAVNSACLSNQALAHEVGHMQQLDHNRENATGMAAYAYSYGYRLCSSGGFVDIMSYPCSTGVPKINYFSNPNVTYNGYPTGISYEANPGNSAETARTLNNTAAQVANYRVGSGTVAPTPPAAPSGLAVQGATSNSVSIGWNDNSTNETGFHVQRSSDGVNFALIATLGAGTRSFVDVTVLARSSYYYRVRAFNSAGASAYSSAVSVTTPDTASVPAAPSSISAVNKGDGSALVSWVDSSGNETGFEVRRRKWDAKLRVWSSAIKVGSVPAGTVRLIDVAGNGTFRYFVRALNSAGGSTLTGPARVRITGGT